MPLSPLLSSGNRWKNQLHGDLFLTRHLLILREQLIPFNMNLQSIEKKLDFTSTGTALTSFVSNSMSLLRFDTTNTFYQIARDGLPGS
jgi:conserved oligomeric Golgi complex subunit 3